MSSCTFCGHGAESYCSHAIDVSTATVQKKKTTPLGEEFDQEMRDYDTMYDGILYIRLWIISMVFNILQHRYKLGGHFVRR